MLMMNGSEGQVSCVVSASQLSLIGSLFAALLGTTYLLEIIIFRSFFSKRQLANLNFIIYHSITVRL